MKLYIVSTPIGNLKDITLRALYILKQVDFICAENPRHSLRLLEHYEIKTPLKPLSQAIKLLKQERDVALITDAGTPGISDPGSKIVSEAVELGVEIVPIPGVSAIITALSVSGIKGSRFLFLGFLPLIKKRGRTIEEINSSKIPVVFYESPHRIIKFLKKLSPQKDLVLLRELTKLHETIYRGNSEKIIKILEKEFTGKIRGEFVVITK